MNEKGDEKSETPNSEWVGWTYAASQNLNAGVPQFDKFIRAERYDGLGVGRIFAGGLLRSVDAEDRTKNLVLGTIPEDVGPIHCPTYANGNLQLCTGERIGENDTIDVNGWHNAPKSDVFFVDVSSSGTLVRVTNSNSVTKYPVQF